MNSHKKINIKAIILLSLVLFSAVFSASAQDMREGKKKKILSALGIAGGITYGKDKWNPEGPLAQEKYLLAFNGAILAEFFHHPRYRWRTELEYNMMGTTEILNSPSGEKVVNRTNYLSFNNYLKISFAQTKFVPYILVGPRLEYLLSRQAAVYQPEISQFNLLHVTGSVGVGAEAMWKNPLRPFIEVLYNHDIMPSYSSYYADGLLPTNIVYRAYELRIGLKYFFDGQTKDACPKVINPAGN
ncbi:MAG: hypothetical protein ACLQQ4_06970 [Bacteroidia bacterium]